MTISLADSKLSKRKEENTENKTKSFQPKKEDRRREKII